MSESKYPEHEKLAKIKDQSQAIGDFLEWLRTGEADPTGFDRSIFLATHEVITEEYSATGEWHDLPKDKWYVGDRLVLFRYNMEELLARYFGIDLKKLEEEKKQMLEELRRVHRFERYNKMEKNS